MALGQPLSPKFNAGELSPRLAARTDLDKYQNGVAVLENMIPLTEGGVMRRPGTRYVAEAKDSTATTRLFPFKKSTTQAYIVEVGDGYARFFRNQGQIAAGATDAAVTNGLFTAGSSGWTDVSTAGGSISHSSSDGSLAFTVTSSSDIAKAEQQVTCSSSVIANEHILQFHLKGEAGDRFTFGIGTSSSQTDIVEAIDKYIGYHAVPFTPNSTEFWLQWSYDGTVQTVGTTIESHLDDVSIPTNSVFELQTPWGSTQLFELFGPQSADVRYMLHNGTPPYRLERRGHTDWSLVEVAWQDGPWLDTNDTDTTLSAASTNGRRVTITASGVTGINGDMGFGSSDVGRLLRVSNPSTSTDNWGWGLITGSTSTTTVVVDIKRNFPSTAATTEWRLGAWSDETGWPGVGTFHEQRLALARSVDQPQTLWFSETGNFETFSPDSPSSSEWEGEVEDDDGLNYTISSDDVEAIEWMTPGKTLQIGTRNAEWEMTSNGAVITPTDTEIRRHTQQGSARIQPLRVGHATLMVQRAKRRIREVAFSFEADGLVATDLTRLAPHMTLGGITEMAYQQEPDSVVWMVRSDGQLVSMTYRREEDVVAFGRHIIGGSYDSGNARIKSVATIPGSTASGQTQSSLDRDEVWVVAERTINGSTKKYIEFFERDYEEGDSQEDSYYLDSLLTYDSTAATSLSGFSHIAAETAGVLANGAIHPDVTVSSSGSVTLDIASSTVQVGLKYTHRLKTFKWNAGAQLGTAQTQTKRIRNVTAILMNSHTLEIGPSSSDLDKFDFREVGDAMDTAVSLFSGEWKVGLNTGWENDPRITIESDDPTPFTILGLVPEIKTNETK